MRYFFTVFCFFTGICCFSQSGNYFLSHYSPGQDRLDNVCFRIAQHQTGMMYFATRSGMLEFDGRNWNQVKGEGAVYTLHISDNGEVFWGGVSGLGKVLFNTHGQPEMQKLSGRARNIFQSAFHNGHLFFVNEETVFDLDVATLQITEITPTQHGSLTGIFELNAAIYVTASDDKMYRLNEGQLFPASPAGPAAGPLVFSAAHDGNYLAGFGNNKVYLFGNGKTARQLLLEDQEYLDRSVVIDGCWVSNELIVLGTLRGGLIFVNITNGKTYEIVNNTKGLPDNEIFTLLTDRSLSVWAAHEFGFTRIVPYLPFRSFNHYSGLQGNLLCAITYENSVFVGTSLGLYKLEKEDIYEEISYYVNAPLKTKADTKPEPVEENPGQAESRKKGIFGIFRRKKSTPPPAEELPPGGQNEIAGTARQKRLKTERIFRTSNYVYRKVKGIEAKVTQLVEVKGKLIAAGLGGTFEINGLNSRILIEAPSRYLYGTREGSLFVSTYTDKVHILHHNGRRWENEDFLVNLNDQINHIFETPEGDVWLCALERFYQVQRMSGAVSDIRIVPINNPNYDELVGIPVKDQLVFASSHGFFSFNRKASTFHAIDSLSGISLTGYFANGAGLWYRDEHGWKVLGNERANRNSGLLNLFRNIRFLLPDKRSGDLWIITGSNELFKFYNDRVAPYSMAFPLALKSVRNGDLVQGGKRLDVNSTGDNKSVTIEVVQPDYLAPQAVEYRYLLKGLDQNWSAWSQNNNIIEIPYLPPGDYVLDVQSRNIFGENESLQKIVLNIIPPYWKRPWFYAFEVLLFSFLVVLSFRLSIRYRIISRLLMLLTIIILIQFLETVIGETLETKTTPVIDFIVQVAIAMLILPVEGFLRERMLRSLEGGDRFYRFILPKIGQEVPENIINNDNA